MTKKLRVAIVVLVPVLGTAASQPTDCGQRPMKGWIEFLDRNNGFCFWYPPTYKTETVGAGVDAPNLKDRQVLATLLSSEPRQEQSDEKEPASITVYLFRGAFALQKLMRDAPTGWMTPPRPEQFGADTFYYYGRGGGGVFYPDMYYFNLHGHALQFLFDGPYPADNNSPTAAAQRVEKVILSSFSTAP